MAITTLLAVHSTEEPVDAVRPIVSFCRKIGAYLNSRRFRHHRNGATAAYGAMPNYYLTDERARVEVEKIVQETDLSASVLVECIDAGIIERTMSRHALYADAAIFAHGSIPGADLPTRAFNGILFNSGQPIIILGAEKDSLPGAKRVIMAWNGEPEAARAIHRRPAAAESVEDIHLVLVDPDLSGAANPGSDMATFLTRHGLRVTIDQLPSGGREVADVLLQHAIDKDADLIVMGVYGHSRLLEWLLGGGTRDLPSKSNLPVSDRPLSRMSSADGDPQGRIANFSSGSVRDASNMRPSTHWTRSIG